MVKVSQAQMSQQSLLCATKLHSLQITECESASAVAWNEVCVVTFQDNLHLDRSHTANDWMGAPMKQDQWWWWWQSLGTDHKWRGDDRRALYPAVGLAQAWLVGPITMMCRLGGSWAGCWLAVRIIEDTQDVVGRRSVSPSLKANKNDRIFNKQHI